MNWRNWLLLALVVVLVAGGGVLACSKGKGAQEATKTGTGTETGTGYTTQQAAKAIEAYGKSSLDKARATQRLGEEHTKDIDRAVEKMNGH